MEDKKIIKLYLERQKTAITMTVLRYGVLCRNIISQLIDDSEEVDECFNDVLLTLWKKIPPDIPQKFCCYIGRIARNISIDAFRRKKKNESQLLSELTDCIPSCEDVQKTVEANELSEIIDNWLMTLSKSDRALFVKRYWYGDSVSKLSKEVGCKENTLTVRLLRLRRSLKEFLEGEGYAI